MSLLPWKLHHLPCNLSLLYPTQFRARPRPLPLRILCARRTGKQRYPSEKKKLKLKHKEALGTIENKFDGIWRLSRLGVPVSKDPGKDFLGVSDGLLDEIAKVLEFPVASLLPQEAFSVVRKSFDARKIVKEPKFVYTVDMDVKKLMSLEPRVWDFISELKPKVGLVEYMAKERASNDLISTIHDLKINQEELMASENGHIAAGSVKTNVQRTTRKPKIVVVGSGPSGLFASLVLAELGAEVTLMERGQPVEQRGRDIGALVVRRILESESNFCFGEGGAGTWSDGKLVTRIGKNSDCVHAVMRTLVHFGAPDNILVNGKPHLGTDRLIPLLQNFRQHLQNIGVNIKFGTRADDLLVEKECVVGVKLSDSRNKPHLNSQKMECEAVVLAVGHSARDIYQMLLSHNVTLVPKDFALTVNTPHMAIIIAASSFEQVGLRIEHPQELINRIQYPQVAAEVGRGRGKVPVADYKVAKYVNANEKDPLTGSAAGHHNCYSFCMCPGGQVVLTSTNPSELCINGMSFSRRSSRWANAALVVTVSSKDFEALNFHGPLAGVEFQREFERMAATMGGGNFVVPVQRATDFVDKKLSGTFLPPSSYRLGVTAANLHELFPVYITEAIQQSILAFDEEMPGFLSEEALLHGVETRTSSPVQIPRNNATYESTSIQGLYPVGEGAGYAGGIVSAAVDGMYAGFAVAKSFNLFHCDIELVLGKSQGSGLVMY